MPVRRMKRKTTTPFSVSKRRKIITRKVARPAPYRRSVSLNYHEFTRYQEAYTITTTAVNKKYAYLFSLGDVINYKEFTAMFDMYKIKKITYKIIQMVSE